MVYVFLAEGFEEIEAITVIDILRRENVDVKTVSLGDKTVVSAHKIPVLADITFDEIGKADAFVLPGGMPGTLNLQADERLLKLLMDNQDRLLAAICAAPIVFGQLGILEGHKATCFGGYEAELKGAQIVDEPVVIDKNIITGRDYRASADFAFAIAGYLK